jgi:hypothetical protein
LDLFKKYNKKKKCWEIQETTQNLAKLSKGLLGMVPVIGAGATRLLKDIMVYKMKKKKYCKKSIAWVKKNL